MQTEKKGPNWTPEPFSPRWDALPYDKRAKLLGLDVYDTAVPIDWVMAGIKATGLNIGTVCWCYDGPGIFGYPVALDSEGKRFLETIENHNKGQDHHDRLICGPPEPRA